MADKLDDYAAIELTCDFANDYTGTVRANAGDLNGRKIRAVLTNGGADIDPEGIAARLLFNPKPDDPDSFGDFLTMSTVANTPTATFEAPIPAGALTKSGNTRMGIAFMQGENENRSIICARPFDVTVEGGVLNFTSGGAVGEFEDAVRRAEAAAVAAAQSSDESAESARQAAESLANIGTSKEESAESARQSAASATAAHTSETNAAASAEAAHTSETNAAASATAAASSAEAAAASATEAHTSETNAAASAEAAHTSETNAADSASTAASSATAAGESKDAAADSATSAAQSATAAETAQQAAEGSATAAAASATAAHTSETNAAASAEAAHTSETNAAASATAAASSAEAAAASVAGFGLETGTVTDIAPGGHGTFEAVPKEGQPGKYIVNVGLVEGQRGENTAAISEVTAEYRTGGTTPSLLVEAGGTPEERTLHFIASGLEGADGHTPVLKPGTVSEVESGSALTISLTAENPDKPWEYTIGLTVPRGQDATVTQGVGITVANGQVSIHPKDGSPIAATADGLDVNIGGSLRVDPVSGDMPARLNVKPKPNAAIESTTEGVGVLVDGKTITFDEQGRLKGGASGAQVATATVTFAPADFNDQLTATKAVDGTAGAAIIAGPDMSDLANARRYYNAGISIQDHGNDADIPDGSIRATLINELTDNLTITLFIFKEQA